MKQKSLKKSILNVLIIIVCILLISNITILYLNSKDSIIGTYQKNGEVNAERVTSELNIKKYEEFLQNPTDNSLYQDLVDELNHVRKSTGSLYVYILDAENKKLKMMIDGRDDPSPIGSEVTGTTYRDAEPAFQGKLTSSDLTKDEEFGDYISSFAPIKNSNGEVIGVLGMDVDANLVKDVQKQVLSKGLPIVISIIIILSALLLIALYFFLNKKMNPLKHLMKVTQTITDGDLAEANKLLNELDIKANNEIGNLYQSTKRMTETMELLIGKIQTIAVTLNDKGTYLSQSSNEVSEGTQQVSTTMEEMASATESEAQLAANLNEHMIEFSNLYQQTTLQGNAIVEATHQLLEESNSGTQLMNDSKDEMEEIYQIITSSVEQVKILNEENKKVSSLVSFISGIADQTNLLSLNASIEAARAGEHGKGFAVVAGEVGNLAKEVSNSVKDIDAIVKIVTSNSLKMVNILETGLDKVRNGRMNLIQTGDTFNNISGSLSLMNELAQDMHDQLSIVSKKETDINDAIMEVASISEENAASVEEVSASSQEIHASIQSLSNLVRDLSQTSQDLHRMASQFIIDK
ncbi:MULTISPECIES: methyl-accepting chemotaxis protein [Bacillus]|uniref:methyl-accepting chemotaxis protein n=1 Tax=Bacillus TaxID=1386 RepID=UPI0005517781|nr:MULTISPECIES: methyl-accepting chemotaxis protein [Bacillus]